MRDKSRLNDTFLWFVAMFVFLYSISGYAVPESLNVHQEPRSVSTLSVKHMLSYYTGGKPVYKLKYAHADMNISIPISQLAAIDGAVLNLKLTPSAALDDQSWMTVTLNGQVVDQFSLKSQGSALIQRIPLPGKYFLSGYNVLRLEASQHYTKVCEYPLAPQLWTQIDTAASSLQIRFTPKRWAPLLSDIDYLFDKTTFSARPVVNFFYGSHSEGDSLDGLALAAQGVGLRYQYLPVSMHAQTISADHLQNWLLQNDKEGNIVSVWVGTTKNLSVLWQSLHVSAPKGAWIGTYAWPGHPHHYVVAVSGDTPAQVRKAAQVFAQPSIPLPPVSHVKITRLKLPNHQRVASPITSKPFDSGAFSFLSAGFHTLSMTGYAPSPASLRIWNGGWDRKAQMHLHLTYAAGMATQSALNILVNGSLQGSIPLNQPLGGRYGDYTVTIPSTVLHPGWNAVSLEPVFVPISNGGECKPFFTGNLWVTVYDNSVFEWAGGGVNGQEPDLATLSADGYPYTKKASGEDMRIYIPNLQSSTLSAALTLMSKIAQIGQRPYLMAQLEAGALPNHGYSGIFVSPWGNIPSKWRHQIQITADHMKEIFPAGYRSYPLSGILSNIDPQATKARIVHGQVSLDADLRSLAFATTWEQDGHPLTLFTAANSETLSHGIDRLVDYGPWSQLKGSMAWWVPGGKKVTSVGFDEEPFRNYGLRGGLSVWVSRHPWVSLLGILVLGIFFVLATRLALRAYSRKHHPKDV